MADFFSLEPKGIETSEIESLPSYICRLAKIHGVTIHRLLTALDSWTKSVGRTFALPANPIYNRGGGVFCGVGTGVAVYIRALAEATGSPHIERTSFVSLIPAISRQGAGLSRRSRAWCPACFLEHEQTGTEFYDRLLWTMAYVTRCPSHKITLASDCPHCLTPQAYYDKDGRLGRCWRCHNELTGDPHSWSYERNPSFGESKCVDLVEAIATGKLKQASPSAFVTFCRELFPNLPRSKRAGLAVEVSRHSWNRDVHLSSPNFSTMVRIAVTTGVPLSDILIDPTVAARVAGDLLPDRIDRRSTRGPHKPPEIFQACEDRLCAELNKPIGYVPPSISVLARELKVSVGFLRHRFPELVERYLNLRTQRREQYTISRSSQLRNALLKGPFGKYPSGRFPTRKSLETWLMEKCSVNRRTARIAVASLFCSRSEAKQQSPRSDLELNAISPVSSRGHIDADLGPRSRFDKIPPSQKRVFDVLLQRGPSTIRELHEIVYAGTDRHYTTTSKILANLRTKGLIQRNEGTLKDVYFVP